MGEISYEYTVGKDIVKATLSNKEMADISDAAVFYNTFSGIKINRDVEILGKLYKQGAEISSDGKEIQFKGDVVIKATAQDVDGGKHEISATLHNEKMAGITGDTKVTMGRSDRFVLKDDLVFMGKTYEAGTLIDLKDGSLVKTESMDKLRFSEIQERGERSAVSGGNYYEVVEKDSSGKIIKSFNLAESVEGKDIYGDGIFEEKPGIFKKIFAITPLKKITVQLKDANGNALGKERTVYIKGSKIIPLQKLNTKSSFVKARVYTSLFESKEVFVPVKSLYSEQYGKGAVNFRMVDVIDEKGNVTGRYSMQIKDFETLSGTSGKEYYMQHGDAVAAARARGDMSFGATVSDIAFELRSSARIMLLGGEIHSASVVDNTKIVGGFTYGHLLAVSTNVLLLGAGGGFRIGGNILKGGWNLVTTAGKSAWAAGALNTAKTMLGKSGAIGKQIWKQVAVLSPFKMTKISFQGIKFAKVAGAGKAWVNVSKSIGRNFAYMKVLNAGLWTAGQLVSNYLPENNAGSDVYRFILTPFARGDFNLKTFVSDVAIGGWDNLMYAGFAGGMYLASPLVSAFGRTVLGEKLGSIGEISTGSGFFARASSKFVNGIIEEGVKERGAGMLLNLIPGLRNSETAKEFIVELLFPGGPVMMKANAQTKTSDISAYNGISEIDLLSKAGVGTLGDLSLLTGTNSVETMIDTIQGSYHSGLSAETFNTLTADDSLQDLVQEMGLTETQIPAFIANIAGSKITLGQISALTDVGIDAAAKIKGVSEIDVLSNAGIKTVGDMGNITGTNSSDEITSRILENYSDRLSSDTIDNLTEDISMDGLIQEMELTGDETSSFITDIAGSPITLGQISPDIGQGMAAVSEKVGVENVKSSVRHDNTLQEIASLSGREVEGMVEKEIDLSSEEKDKLYNEGISSVADATLSQVAAVTGRDMLSLANNMGADFVQARVSVNSGIATLGSALGMSVEETFDVFGMTENQIRVAKNLSYTSDEAKITVGSIFRTLEQDPSVKEDPSKVLADRGIKVSPVAVLSNTGVNKAASELGVSADVLFDELGLGETTVGELAAARKVEVEEMTKGSGFETATSETGLSAEMFTAFDGTLNEAVPLISTRQIETVIGKMGGKYHTTSELNVSIDRNGILESAQGGKISTEVKSDKVGDSTTYSLVPASIKAGSSFRNRYQKIKNRINFEGSAITIRYENGTKLAQFTGVDRIESTKDSKGNTIVKGFKGKNLVDSFAFTKADTEKGTAEVLGYSKKDLTQQIAQNFGVEGEVDTDISDLFDRGMKPENFKKEDIEIRTDTKGKFAGFIATDENNAEMVVFAEKLSKITAAFVGVKMKQAVNALTSDINEQIEVKDGTASIGLEGLQMILRDSPILNITESQIPAYASAMVGHINTALREKNTDKVTAEMIKDIINKSGAEDFVGFMTLRENQAKKFLEFIQTPSMGHEIGTGEGKTDFLIHFNAIAGLINGKNRSVIILSDKGKLTEAYSDNTKELYASLFGKGSVEVIDSNTKINRELLNKVESERAKFVFTESAVMGFMTDSKRVKGSVESKLFNALTDNVQLVQDEIHTIHGQSYIRSRGEDKKLTKEQITATEVMGDFIKTRAKELGVEVNAETGYADLSGLVVTENKGGEKISPVFNDKFFTELAKYLTDTNYRERMIVEKAMLNGSDYLKTPELVHIRSVAKTLARFYTEAQGVHYGAVNFNDEKLLRSEQLGLSEDFVTETLKKGKGDQIVPVSLGKADITKQFSDPYEAAVKHYFGLKKIGKATRLDTVTTTPESTQANYLEFLSIAKDNGSSISSMTGTYNLIVGMMHALGVNVDNSERDMLLGRYIDTSNELLVRAINAFLGNETAMILTDNESVSARAIKKVMGVTGIEKIFRGSDIGPDGIKAADKGGSQNYVVIPEAEGLHQSEIRDALEAHLRALNMDGADFRFVYHDSFNQWTLYEWDTSSGEFKAETLDFDKDVKRMLDSSSGGQQTVILGNVGDVFGLDLKVRGNTKFIDILDSKTLLTTALQGFGRVRGYDDGGMTLYNDREVYMVGERTGKIAVNEVFDVLIENENQTVQSITLQVLGDAIKHSAVSLLKRIQDQAEGAPSIGAYKKTGIAAFTLGSSSGIPAGGILASILAKGLAQRGDALSLDKRTEYDVIEEKLVRDFWNVVGQNQDNSMSSPQETKEYLAKDFYNMHKLIESMTEDANFMASLSESSRDMLTKYVAENADLFNLRGEMEVRFLKEGAIKQIREEKNLFSTENTLKSVAELIETTVKESDVPEKAIFGKSETSRAATQMTMNDVKTTLFEGESFKEIGEQEKFMEKNDMIRSDGTLNSTGNAYINQLYSKLKNMTDEDLASFMSIGLRIGLPPEEARDNIGKLSRGLINEKYIDLGTLNERTVDHLMNLSYALEGFKSMLPEEALENLRQSGIISTILSQKAPGTALQVYIAQHIEIANKKTALQNMISEILLENKASASMERVGDKMRAERATGNETLLEKGILALRTGSAPDLISAAANRWRLNSMQKNAPLRLSSFREMAENIAAETKAGQFEDRTVYQLTRIFFAPFITETMFTRSLKTQEILDKHFYEESGKFPLEGTLSFDNLIEGQKILILKLLGIEEEQAKKISAANRRLELFKEMAGGPEDDKMGKMLAYAEESMLTLVIGTLKKMPDKLNLAEKIGLINWVAQMDITEGKVAEVMESMEKASQVEELNVLLPKNMSTGEKAKLMEAIIASSEGIVKKGNTVTVKFGGKEYVITGDDASILELLEKEMTPAEFARVKETADKEFGGSLPYEVTYTVMADGTVEVSEKSAIVFNANGEIEFMSSTETVSTDDDVVFRGHTHPHVATKTAEFMADAVSMMIREAVYGKPMIEFMVERSGPGTFQMKALTRTGDEFTVSTIVNGEVTQTEAIVLDVTAIAALQKGISRMDTSQLGALSAMLKLQQDELINVTPRNTELLINAISLASRKAWTNDDFMKMFSRQISLQGTVRMEDMLSYLDHQIGVLNQGTYVLAFDAGAIDASVEQLARTIEASGSKVRIAVIGDAARAAELKGIYVPEDLTDAKTLSDRIAESTGGETVAKSAIILSNRDAQNVTGAVYDDLKSHQSEPHKMPSYVLLRNKIEGNLSAETNMANLVHSVIRSQPCVVAVGYDDRDDFSSIQALLKNIGYFAVIERITETIGQIMNAINATITSL
ncbi:MAG: hypothetical protein ABH862_01020 [Candidatus Omnitrophota bacterium]